MQVRILTPQKQLLNISAAAELYFPGDAGMIGVFPDHAPLVTTVSTGVVVCTEGDSNMSHFLKVAGGVAEITNTTATLLVDVGEEAAEIDLERAKRALERAEARLSAKELGNVDLERAEKAKARATARIEAVELYEKGSGKSEKIQK